MGPAFSVRVSKAPQTVFLGTSLWSHHDRETWHWGGYSSAQQLRENNKAAQIHSSCTSSKSVCWGYIDTFPHFCTLQKVIHSTDHFPLAYTVTHTLYVHPCTPHPRATLMKTPIAEWTVRWLAQRKHYTSTFRHMACGPTDGRTHMVLVASAASHGRKAQCSPLIRLQNAVQSTPSTAGKSRTVRVASFCL